jgi:hypothetical protein
MYDYYTLPVEPALGYCGIVYHCEIAYGCSKCNFQFLNDEVTSDS